MKLILLFSLFLSFVYAGDCDKDLIKEVKAYEFKKASDTKDMQKVFLKTLPCLGNKNFVKLNVEVMKMYARAAKFHDFFESFELLYPFYDKNQEYFVKEVDPKLTEEEKKLIKDHYQEYKDYVLQGGNG